MKSNKYGLLILSVFFLGFITFVANAIELTYLSNLDESYAPPENFIDQAFSILGTFWRLVTFRVYGLPSFVNAILGFTVYTPILFFIGFLFINWIRGND